MVTNDIDSTICGNGINRQTYERGSSYKSLNFDLPKTGSGTSADVILLPHE